MTSRIMKHEIIVESLLSKVQYIVESLLSSIRRVLVHILRQRGEYAIRDRS